MKNICSVTMYFRGEKSAIRDLHAKCEQWLNAGGRATKLLSALNISKEDLDLRYEVCYVGELFVDDSTGDECFGIDLDCAEDTTPDITHPAIKTGKEGYQRTNWQYKKPPK